MISTIKLLWAGLWVFEQSDWVVMSRDTYLQVVNLAESLKFQKSSGIFWVQRTVPVSTTSPIVDTQTLSAHITNISSDTSAPNFEDFYQQFDGLNHFLCSYLVQAKLSIHPSLLTTKPICFLLFVLLEWTRKVPVSTGTEYTFLMLSGGPDQG